MAAGSGLRDEPGKRAAMKQIGNSGRAPGPLASAGRGLIRLYQHTAGPLIPSSCRFVPSCSRYTHEALGAHGFFKGVWLGLKRIGRCHPFAEGGFDPVPAREVSR